MGRVFGGATGRPRLVGCAWHTHGRPVEVAAGAGDSVSYSRGWVRAVHGGDRGTCETRSRVALSESDRSVEVTVALVGLRS